MFSSWPDNTPVVLPFEISPFTIHFCKLVFSVTRESELLFLKIEKKNLHQKHVCGQKCGNRYFLISAVHEIQNYWLLLCCGEFQDCYCVSIKKIQIPFQGDDTKGLEGNWISLQSWVPWVTVIPRQTSGTELH